jgi:hypothetical protein
MYKHILTHGLFSKEYRHLLPFFLSEPKTRMNGERCKRRKKRAMTLANLIKITAEASLPD